MKRDTAMKEKDVQEMIDVVQHVFRLPGNSSGKNWPESVHISGAAWRIYQSKQL